MNRFFSISGLAIAATLATQLTASAGYRTGVDNTIELRTGTETTKTNLEVDTKSVFESTTNVTGETTTNKFEAFAPNATVWGSFYNGEFSARGVASTDPTNQDPVIINLTSTQNSEYTATERVEENVTGTVRSTYTGTVNGTFIDAGAYFGSY